MIRLVMKESEIYDGRKMTKTIQITRDVRQGVGPSA